MKYDDFLLAKLQKDIAADPNIKDHEYDPIRFYNKKNARVLVSDVPLMGIKYYLDAFKFFCQKSESSAKVYFDPNNIHDKNAIVFRNERDETIGHVPRELAEELVEHKDKALYIHPRHKYINYTKHGFYYDIIEVDNPQYLTEEESEQMWRIEQLSFNILKRELFRTHKEFGCFRTIALIIIAHLSVLAAVLAGLGYFK